MIEVLPGDQKALHEKGRFDQVASVVVRAEVWIYLSGAAIEEVRPDPVKTVGLGKKANDFEHAFGALLAGYEAAVNSNDQRHDAEAGRADGHQVLVTRKNFNGRSGVRVAPSQ